MASPFWKININYTNNDTTSTDETRIHSNQSPFHCPKAPSRPFFPSSPSCQPTPNSTFKLDTVSFLCKPPDRSKTLSCLCFQERRRVGSMNHTVRWSQFRVPRPNFLSSFPIHPRYLETRQAEQVPADWVSHTPCPLPFSNTYPHPPPKKNATPCGKSSIPSIYTNIVLVHRSTRALAARYLSSSSLTRYCSLSCTDSMRFRARIWYHLMRYSIDSRRHIVIWSEFVREVLLLNAYIALHPNAGVLGFSEFTISSSSLNTKLSDLSEPKPSIKYGSVSVAVLCGSVRHSGVGLEEEQSGMFHSSPVNPRVVEYFSLIARQAEYLCRFRMQVRPSAFRPFKRHPP